MRAARFTEMHTKLHISKDEPDSFLSSMEGADTHMFVGIVEVVQELGSNHLQNDIFFCQISTSKPVILAMRSVSNVTMMGK